MRVCVRARVRVRVRVRVVVVVGGVSVYVEEEGQIEGGKVSRHVSSGALLPCRILWDAGRNGRPRQLHARRAHLQYWATRQRCHPLCPDRSPVCHRQQPALRLW